MNELETTNGKLHCHVCQRECLVICRSCNRSFCEIHTSSLDSTYCAPCVDFTNTHIINKPLVDAEGAEHKGRQLILTGEVWMRNRDLISKMTDVELEAKLTALKTAVHEAEMILDSRKLGRRRLIGAMDSVHKNATKVAGSPSEKVEIAKDALASLKKLGLNKDAIANVLLKLAQQKGKT